MLRRNLSLALLASGSAAALMAKEVEAQACTAPCYAQTPQEATAGITPTNTAYLPGDVRRYGADPTGGSSSTVALQNAIKTGYSLYFCDGNFMVGSALSPKSNTTWWGTGTLTSGAFSGPIVAITSGTTKFVFEINTDMSNNTAPVRYMMAVDGSTYITIQNGYHTKGAIEVAPSLGCQYVKIRGNTFYQAVLGSSTTQAVIYVNTQTTDFEIVDNEIVGSPQTGTGIAVFNSALRGVISGNRCTGCTGSGIWIDSGQYIVISNNICYKNLQSGIGLNTSNANANGWASFCSVTGNICAGNTFDGIDYNVSGTSQSQFAAFSTISSNVLSGNGGSGSGGTGMYLSGVDEVTVSGNTAVGNYEQGIFLNSAYYCTVTGNGVVSNGSGVTGEPPSGIAVHGSYNTITGNTSTNNDGAANQQYGIYEPAGYNYNCISGNNLNNNSSGGLLVNGANTNAQANQPANVEKLFYADIVSSYTTPSTSLPAGSLWLNPSAGRLYVLQGGAWTVK